MEDVYRKYGSDNFEILGMDSWDGDPEDIAEFRRASGATFPILMNASEYIKKLNTIDNRGTFFLLDTTGTVAASCDDGYPSLDCFAPSLLDSVVGRVVPGREPDG